MVAPSYNWTGFYAGVNVGGSSSRANTSSITDCPTSGGYFCDGSPAGLANRAAIEADGSGSFNRNAFTGGGQIGYNWQIGNFVLGPELDIESFSAKTSSSVSHNYPGFPETYVVGTSTDTTGSSPPDFAPAGR